MATSTRSAKGYVTVAEAAHYTGLSEGTIRNLMATRELTAFRPVPGRVLLDLNDVDKFMRRSANRPGTRGSKPHGLGIAEGGQAAEVQVSSSPRKGGGAPQRKR